MIICLVDLYFLVDKCQFGDLLASEFSTLSEGNPVCHKSGSVQTADGRRREEECHTAGPKNSGINLYDKYCISRNI